MRISGRFYFGGIFRGWHYDLGRYSDLFFPAGK